MPTRQILSPGLREARELLRPHCPHVDTFEAVYEVTHRHGFTWLVLRLYDRSYKVRGNAKQSTKDALQYRHIGTVAELADYPRFPQHQEYTSRADYCLPCTSKWRKENQ